MTKFVPKLWYFLGTIVAIEFEHGYAVRDGRSRRAFSDKPHFIWRAFS